MLYIRVGTNGSIVYLRKAVVALGFEVIDVLHTFSLKLLSRKPFMSHIAMGASFSDRIVMETIATFDCAPIASCMKENSMSISESLVLHNTKKYYHLCVSDCNFLFVLHYMRLRKLRNLGVAGGHV